MENIIGVDVGGTTIVGGRIECKDIVDYYSADTKADEGGDTTLEVLKDVVRRLMTTDTKAIGVGVPSVVDRSKGIVYNVQNINKV